MLGFSICPSEMTRKKKWLETEWVYFISQFKGIVCEMQDSEAADQITHNRN